MKWLLKRRLSEKRPLPVGVSEFNAWSDRIIKAAALPSTIESQKYVLANVICNNCGPATAFESDAFFIGYLRKVAANQVADEMRKQIYEARKQNQVAASAAPESGDGKEALAVGSV